MESNFNSIVYKRIFIIVRDIVDYEGLILDVCCLVSIWKLIGVVYGFYRLIKKNYNYINIFGKIFFD